ncbi:hypothetical protein [Helicobacter burdigaliensis]|uniref:hypothetical protein n=1 Tax=Helicobacter burdigaliensis TaxID=2315334 RepID=UPI001E2B8254|nr:hypothetical protein [Helicobacter burdigaliensis]
MYAITGILYISGFDRNSGATLQTFSIHQNIQKGKEIDFLKDFLSTNIINFNHTKEFKLKSDADEKDFYSIGTIAKLATL